MNSIAKLAAFLALSSAFNPSQAQVSVEIDGQTVAGPGEVAQILFNPGSNGLEIKSVFEDVRCVPSDPDAALTSGSARLVLDQINGDVETDAEYPIAAMADGGLIEFDLVDSVFRVSTTDTPEQTLDCARFRNALWASDFEDLFSLDSDEPESPVAPGSEVRVPITVSNKSLTLVSSDIEIGLAWSASALNGDPVSGPTPSFSRAVDMAAGDQASWIIDQLWPGETITIDVIYSDVPADTVLSTDGLVLGARNREATEPVGFGNPAPLVVDVVVGDPVGDLAAGLSFNSPVVAGSGSGNLTLTYSVSNNSAVEVTDVEATLAPVNLPAAVTLDSETPSEGSFANGSWTVPSVPSGASVTLTQVFSVGADAAAGAQVCGDMSIDSAAESLENVVDDQVDGCATVERQADLSTQLQVIEPSFAANTITPGDTLQYGFNIDNAGPSVATQLDSTLTLTVSEADTGVAILGSDDPLTQSNSGTFSNPAPESIDFSVDGDLQPSGSSTAEIGVSVPGDTPDQTEICLSVSSLGANEDDGNASNDSFERCVVVDGAGG